MSAPDAPPADAAIRAVNCTNCGAGLPVLGGGRVRTTVCGYCGAALDATDAYRVLAVYDGMERPDSPFRLGMTGEVDGVPFTVIGTMGQVERYGGETWRWTDHMLYSPTHGYAWLTVEDGHVLLTRKVRDLPRGRFLDPRTADLAEARPKIVWRGREYVYYDSSTSEIDFLEGEFNFRPARGERAHRVALMPNGPATDMFAFATDHGGTEQEAEVTRYAPELAAAFGAEAPRPVGVHPLQPYAPSRHVPFLKVWFGAMTAAAAVVAFVVAGLPDAPRDLLRAGLTELPAEAVFDVDDVTRPVRLRLSTDAQNNWAAFELEVTGPDGTPAAATFREISYYSGGRGEDRWSEGSRTATLGFQPTAPGPHTVRVDVDEIGRDPGRISTLTVAAQDGVTTPRWVVFALAGFALAFALAMSGTFFHRRRRWAGSDWEDD